MPTTVAGPFAPYPADAAAVADLGDAIVRNGDALASVGRTVAGRGLRAATEDSTGLYDGIVTTTRAPGDDGARLAAVGRVASFAMSLWSRGIGAYDNTIEDLNTEWATAKAADFGVGSLELDRGSMKPADIDDAVADHTGAIDRARGDLWGRLVRRRNHAQDQLDTVADDAASLLRNANNPNVQALAARVLAHRRRANAVVREALYPASLREFNHRMNPNYWQAIAGGLPESVAAKIADANPASILGYGNVPDITAEGVLKFIFGDPRPVRRRRRLCRGVRPRGCRHRAHRQVGQSRQGSQVRQTYGRCAEPALADGASWEGDRRTGRNK